MTDPQNPAEPTPPPANVPPAPPAAAPAEPAPSPAAAPAYAAAPPPQYGEPAPAAVPGKTLGIVAFVVSFFASLIGLILGIVALVQSRKAGHKNGWAVAAIILGAVFFVITIIVVITLIGLAVSGAAQIAEFCEMYGPGSHETTTGLTIDCP
jgi:hypothetical protein